MVRFKMGPKMRLSQLIPVLVILVCGASHCRADGIPLYDGNNPRFVPVEDGSPDGTSSVSLMIAFHGLGSGPKDIMESTGLAELARDKKFILAAPQGRGELVKGWAAGECCLTDTTESAKDDDVKFVSKLIVDLKKKYPRIDLEKIYLVGFSNGAILAHRLAYQLEVPSGSSSTPNRIAGIATLAGTLSLPIADRTPDVAPIPWIHFHGTKDTVINPTETRVVGGFRVSTLAETLTVLRDRNNVTGDPTKVTIEKVDDSTKVNVMEWTPALTTPPSGARVKYYEIEGGGHTWPGHAPPSKIVAALKLIGKSLGLYTQDIKAEIEIAKFFSL